MHLPSIKAALYDNISNRKDRRLYSTVRAVLQEHSWLMLADCWLSPRQYGLDLQCALSGCVRWPSGWLPASCRPALLSAAAGTCRALQGIMLLRKSCCNCSTQLPTRTFQTCQKLPLHLLEPCLSFLIL